MSAYLINISELIDRQPVGRLQIRILILCGLVALLDGFDLLAIGVAAPAMTADLHIAPDELGALFSAALFGLMLGACTLGPIADRYGRRAVLIGATVLFGLFTLCTAGAMSFNQMLLFRFLAGVGLGGAMPSFISLAAEYMPRARRQEVIGLLWTGFPLGGAIVGLLASWLMAQASWRSLFAIGGTLPLVLAIALIFCLPESLEFLLLHEKSAARLRQILARINPSLKIAPAACFVIDGTHRRGAAIGQLFQDGRAATTLLLWASYFATFLLLITASAWTPALLHRAGIDTMQATLGVALFALGSVAGTPLAGFLITNFQARNLLPAALLVSAVALSAAGQIGLSLPLVLMCLALAGFCLGAASSGLIALAPLLYPTSIRSTGVGWAMGLGRFGSFIGPIAVGILVSRGWQMDDTFIALALPALAAALVTSQFDRHGSRGEPEIAQDAETKSLPSAQPVALAAEALPGAAEMTTGLAATAAEKQEP